MSHDEKTNATLSDLLEQHGLTVDSRLYRYTLPEFDSEAASGLSVTANPDPSEARNCATSANSVALAIRPRGVAATISSRNSSPPSPK